MAQTSPFLSTDPNAGQAVAASRSPFLSTDPNAGDAVKPDFKTTAEKPSWLDLAKETMKGAAAGLNPLPLLKQMYGAASTHYDAAEKAAKDGRLWDVLKQTGAAAFAPPETLVTGAAQTHWNELKQAKQAYDDGRVSEAVGHTVAAAIPFLGPMAAKAGEQIGSGDPRTMARGVGTGMAALTPSALKYGAEVARTGSLAPTAADVAAAGPLTVRVPAVARNPNPAEAAASDFALERGVPIDVGTATGNPALRGARALTEHTSLTGAFAGTRARAAQAQALTRVGGDLADQVYPSPVVPTQAGEGLRGAIETLRDQLHEQANTAYDKLREIETNPTLARQVPPTPTGDVAARMQESLGGIPTTNELLEMQRIKAELENLPFVKRTWNAAPKKSGNAAGGDADIVAGAAGAPVYSDILAEAPGVSSMTRGEVFDSIRSALETGKFTNAAKGALEVARKRIAGQFTGADGVSRPSLPPDARTADLPSTPWPVDLTAPKQVLKPVYDQMTRQMPLTQQMANPGLKAIENIVTGPDYAPVSQIDRDLSAIKAVARQQGGVAKLAVVHLEKAVQAAVERGGPEAVQALDEGRAATVAKYGAQSVLDDLNAEPRATFDKLTRPKDASVEQLKAVRELAPQEMPKLGRAVLEDLFETATADGGFGRAQSVQTKWQNLGPQTKHILFGDPAVVANLDRFFALARHSAVNPNPSGSAYLGALAAHGYFLRDPVSFTTWEIAGAALSKLLRSPQAVRALTQGFGVTVGNKPAASATFAAITKAAADAGVSWPMAAENRSDQPAARGQR
jgi:hypothetical protein